MIKAILAISQNEVLGDSSKPGLVWDSPEDLKRFRSLTEGKHVYVGRKTYEQMPKSYFKTRVAHVLTKDATITLPNVDLCVNRPVWSFKQEMYGRAEDSYIIGGKEIYEFFAPIVDMWLISVIQLDVELTSTTIRYIITNMHSDAEFRFYQGSLK